MKRVLAESAGVVREVLVAVGDTIIAGQDVATVEIMKMHFPLQSNIGGIVRALKVAAGDVIAKGATLLEVE